jgi:general secretion pathway protein I
MTRRQAYPKAFAQAGFSLLEVLVAFSILALSLGVLMQIFSGAMRNAVLSDQYSQATLLAQSKLSSVGSEEPLRDGETQGSFENGMRWRVTVTPYEEIPAEGAEQAEEEEPAVRPASRRRRRIEGYRVIVEVSWEDADKLRRVELESLRIASASRLRR